MEVFAVYDTDQQIESNTTADLLGDILINYIPESGSWLSVPDEDDPMGERWQPEWADISVAIAVLEKFINSSDASCMVIHGYTASELINELNVFLAELTSARAHTTRFYLCMY